MSGIARFLARLLFRITLRTEGPFPPAGPVLVVANHTSYLDWLVLLCVLKRQPVIALSREYESAPRLLWLMKLFGISTTRYDRTTCQELLELVARCEVICLFPEEYLTRNGQRGDFLMPWEPLRDKAPIVPIFLRNLWGALGSWQGGSPWKLPLWRRPIHVHVGRVQQWSSAGELRAELERCGAEAGIEASSEFLPAARVFVRNACSRPLLFQTAVIDTAGEHRSLTWGKLLVACWCVTSQLRKRLGEEPNVGVWLPTGVGSALANVSLAFLGKTSVNLNTTAGREAVASALQQSGVRQVITADRFTQRVPLELPEGVEIIRLEEIQKEIGSFARLWRFLMVLLLPGKWLDFLFLGLSRLKLDDPLTILFSSGSTGEPKGVILSHRNVTANTDSFIRGVALVPSDRMMAVLPFFHSFGYTVCLWAPLALGMSAVFHPDPRAAVEIADITGKYRATILISTATFLRFYMRRAVKEQFQSLRLVICGAEKLPVALSEEFEAKFGVLPLEGYGCTELSPVVSVNLHDVALGGRRQQGNCPGTIGRPIPDVCVRTYAPDTRELLPHGSEGLLGIRGPNITRGYLGRPDLTADCLADGWWITGDVGFVKDDGFIQITGRLSRFAKIAGEMVPLEKLDEEMHTILGVAGERLLALAAIPDDRRGERIIVLHLEEVTLRLEGVFQELRHRGHSNLWIPDLRDCRSVGAFPVLSTGKLDLRRLAEEAFRRWLETK